jgi:alkanesulfonate monooxygenase SsuD/methylene tetrahydromethanopterin reductase-like flavin-dependent oxidoreductase (luciferase family)
MGFVADSDAAARDSFYPGWAQMIGAYAHERGWPQPDRAQFGQMTGPNGAFLVGSPETVVAKIRHADDVLGGLSRVAFQMTSAAFETEVMLRSIELLGTEVAPAVQSVA